MIQKIAYEKWDIFPLVKTGEGMVGLGTADTDSGEMTRYSLWRRRDGRDDTDFTWLTELLKRKMVGGKAERAAGKYF